VINNNDSDTAHAQSRPFPVTDAMTISPRYLRRGSIFSELSNEKRNMPKEEIYYFVFQMLVTT